MKKLYVYSGNYRMGNVGEKTPLKDYTEKELYVGDIVITCTFNEHGVSYIHGLTVVVSDKYTSYYNGTHVINTENPEYFVMGIKNVDFMGKDSSEWIVKKVKDFNDIIENESWKDYGFNYKSV